MLIPSLAVSLAVCDHVPESPLSNTYAAPENCPLVSSPSAPTTALEPETATLRPKSPLAWPSSGRSFWVCGHSPSEFLSITYAAPARCPFSSSPSDPTIAASPEIATLEPAVSILFRTSFIAASSSGLAAGPVPPSPSPGAGFSPPPVPGFPPMVPGAGFSPGPGLAVGPVSVPVPYTYTEPGPPS